MTRKKILIISASILGVVLIAGGVVTALLIVNGSPTPETPAPTQTETSDDPLKQEAQTVPDLSVDLGACTLFTKESVAAALTPEISAIPDFTNRGFGHEANGDQSQSCVYDFGQDGKQDNRLTVTVTAFTEQTHKTDALNGFNISKLTAVEGVGEAAYFTSDTDTAFLHQTTYTLFVVKDMQLITLSLAQPNKTNPFSTARAQSALVAIAKTRF